MDVTSQTLSTDFDTSSHTASSTISPFYTSCSDLLHRQKSVDSSNRQQITRTSTASYDSQNKRYSGKNKVIITSVYIIQICRIISEMWFLTFLTLICDFIEDVCGLIFTYQSGLLLSFCHIVCLTLKKNQT